MVIEALRQLLNSMDYGIEKGNLEKHQKDFGEWSRLREQNVVSEAAYQDGIKKAAQGIDESSRKVGAIIEAQQALKAQRDPNYQKISAPDAVASFLRETPPGLNQTAAPTELQMQVPEGWTKTQEPAPLPEETYAELSSREAQAAEAGYTPPKAEATGRMYAPEGGTLPSELQDQPTPFSQKIFGKKDQAGREQTTAEINKNQAPAAEPKQRTYREYLNDPAVPEGDKHVVRRDLLIQERKDKYIRAQKYADKFFPVGSEEHKRTMDSLASQIDRMYDPEELVPLEKTDLFKNIASKYSNDQYRRSISAMANLRGELEKAAQIKDRTERVNYLMAQMPKMLNTLAADSSDAVGIEEFKKLAPELRGLWSSPITQWAELIRLNGTRIFGDPDAFIKKATSIYNVGASNMNDRVAHDEKVLGKHTYKTTAVKMNLLAAPPEPGKESPAQMEAMRSGKTKSTTPYAPVNKADPRGNQPMIAPVTSAPLPTGRVAPKGAFIYGPSKSQSDILEGVQ
jgi:hypothetical protein